ncbi:MAG: hypothetical protein R2755_30335 [Acidimicrobiales bacterium]
MFFDDVASRPTLAAAAKRGEIRRLVTGVWTADTISPDGEIVAENLWLIVSRVFPDAILVDRTAAHNGKIDRGVVTVSTDGRKDPLELPGDITILVRAREAAEDDMVWVHGLTIASPARTLADNTAPSRARRAAVGRTLNDDELLDWLANKALAWGSERMARLRADSLRHLSERPERHRPPGAQDRAAVRSAGRPGGHPEARHVRGRCCRRRGVGQASRPHVRSRPSAAVEP